MVASDWCQKLLYEKHSLNFVTAMLQICSAYIDCGGEIYFVNMFRVVPCFYNIMMPESFRNFMESRCMTAGVPIGSTQTALMLSAAPIYCVN